MPKVSPIQTSFAGGEISPLLYGRVDADRYKSSLAKAENYVPTLQGPVTRRPGTYYVSEVKDSSKKTRLERFEFSTTQAYVLEFGNLYIRFYKDHGQITSSGSAVEVVSPYVEADLFQLKFSQSADTIYITHPSYAPRKLTRRSHTSWTLTTISFSDGPYLPTNTLAKYIRFNTTSGNGVGFNFAVDGSGNAITVNGAANNGSGLIRLTTATAHPFQSGDIVRVNITAGTTEANGTWTAIYVDSTHLDLEGSAFVNAYILNISDAVNWGLRSTEVGRSIRVKVGANWGWVKIASVVELTGTYTGDIQAAIGGTTYTSTFRMGVWSDFSGYPGTSVFHEDRLTFAGATSYPQRIDGSNSGDYENFAPSALDGTVSASNAIAVTINANDVNVIRWLTSDEKGLLAGTVGGEWVIRPSTQSEALSPTNITAKKATSYGSANVQPVQIGKATLFLQRSAKKLRELTYFYDVDGFRASDLTLLSEHVTGAGISQMAYQKEPHPIVWCVRSDGVLAAMTYDRDPDSLKVGWSRHVLGGDSDAAGNDAIVESVAVIPAPDGTREELWMVVKRYINGSTKRYIEYMTKFFDDLDDQQDCFYVDCGLTYDSPKTISGATVANPVVITAAAHGFSNGDKVLISGVQGMTQLNGETYLAAGVTANTFQLADLSGTLINGTSYSTYVSGGEVRKLVSTVSGLSHLNGQTVDILGDGAVQPQKTVSGGSVTLSYQAAVVQVGLPIRARGQMLRIEAGAADGTALGKTRRTHRVAFLVHRTLGLKFGTDFDNLDEVTFRTSSDEATRAVPLYSGVLSETIKADYDTENMICWQQDQPLPGTFLAVMPQMETQDR